MEILFCPVVDEAIGSRDYVPIPFMAVSQSLQGQPIASGTSLLRIPLVPPAHATRDLLPLQGCSVAPYDKDC